MNIDRSPSAAIDAAICNLLDTIAHYQDEHFSAEWMHLSEAEVEYLTLALLDRMRQQLVTQTLAFTAGTGTPPFPHHQIPLTSIPLDGRLLSGLLLTYRENRQVAQMQDQPVLFHHKEPNP